MLMLPRDFRPIIVLTVIVSACAPVMAGPIDIVLQPTIQTVGLGSNVSVGVWVQSNDGANHLMAAADVMFAWDNSYLQFNGVNNAGAVPLLASYLPNISPNEALPPVDGDGFYQAYAFLGSPINVTPAGVLLTTFTFTSLAPTLSTLVEILPGAGSPNINTAVYDGTVPNLVVTGNLGFTKIKIVPEPSTIGLLLAASMLFVRRRR